MSFELKDLSAVHKVVAREMALGFSLKEICESRNLNITSWYKITSSSLFIQEIERLQKEIENDIIDQEVKDPIRIRLKMEADRAVRRLAEERDNFNKETDGATASTRIAASNSILDRLGYGGRVEEKPAGVTIIISGSKIDQLKDLKIPVLPQEAQVKL